jgi:hypothetical protein
MQVDGSLSYLPFGPEPRWVPARRGFFSVQISRLGCELRSGGVPFDFFGEPSPFFGKLKPSRLRFDVPSGSGECQALLRQFAVLVRVFKKSVHP